MIGAGLEVGAGAGSGRESHPRPHRKTLENSSLSTINGDSCKALVLPIGRIYEDMQLN